jgi:hypothetical protein
MKNRFDIGTLIESEGDLFTIKAVVFYKDHVGYQVAGSELIILESKVTKACKEIIVTKPRKRPIKKKVEDKKPLDAAADKVADQMKEDLDAIK